MHSIGSADSLIWLHWQMPFRTGISGWLGRPTLPDSSACHTATLLLHSSSFSCCVWLNQCHFSCHCCLVWCVPCEGSLLPRSPMVLHGCTWKDGEVQEQPTINQWIAYLDLFLLRYCSKISWARSACLYLPQSMIGCQLLNCMLQYINMEASAFIVIPVSFVLAFSF